MSINSQYCTLLWLPVWVCPGTGSRHGFGRSGLLHLLSAVSELDERLCKRNHYLGSLAGCHECGRGTQWAQSDPVDEIDTNPLWNAAVITQTTRFHTTRIQFFPATREAVCRGLSGSSYML